MICCGIVWFLDILIVFGVVMLRVLEERVGVEKLVGWFKVVGLMLGMVNDVEVDGDGWLGLMFVMG